MIASMGDFVFTARLLSATAYVTLLFLSARVVWLLVQGEGLKAWRRAAPYASLLLFSGVGTYRQIQRAGMGEPLGIPFLVSNIGLALGIIGALTFLTLAGYRENSPLMRYARRMRERPSRGGKAR